MRALAALLLAVASAAFAQGPQPYAGQDSRAVKALSADELKGYLAGAGTVVRLERELDALFASKKATPELVDVKLAEIGAAQGRYRGSHLTTHIEAAKVLTPGQIARYDALRGYASSTGGEAGRTQHRH